MRGQLLMVLFGLFITSQSIEAKANVDVVVNRIETLDNDLRSISDLWNNIKDTATNVWNSIKEVAEHTKQKIKSWMDNAKKRADEIKIKFEERIKELQEQGKTILEQLVGTGQLVKECVKKENEAVKDILMQIVSYVTLCLSNTLEIGSRLLDPELRFELNDIAFLSDVETKMNNCMEEKDVETCLLGVKKDIFSTMDKIEQDILIARNESRGITDDLLEKLINCSLEGLMDASNVIAAETMQIVECVMEG